MMGFNDIQPQVLAALLVDKTFKNALDTAIETALHSNLTKGSTNPNQVKNRTGWACCLGNCPTTPVQVNIEQSKVQYGKAQQSEGQQNQTLKQIVDEFSNTINAGLSTIPDYSIDLEPLDIHALGVDAYLNGKLNSTGIENTMENIKSGSALMVDVLTGYAPLASVLFLALEQAQSGKGSQRHQVGDMPFIKQPICELARMYGVGYNFGQAAKKAHETQQLTSLKAKQAELLGAINYLAAAYIVISEQE